MLIERTTVVHNVLLCLLLCNLLLSHYSALNIKSQQIIRVYSIDFLTP